mgnify:CR=1 FL=1
MDLQAPVQFVKGIGPQKAEALGRVGVVSAEDLLLHLPMRYEDRRSFARVADLDHGSSGFDDALALLQDP